ncbi:enoyl-CoA hydratase isomerase family [Rhizoctonia solani]|uniref:Probable enoyl-CoA hydratase, mitochondrial n=1 Tax=Rhizoctonia solani TaxID=456999 RepID=A0A8H7H8G4_9AGAM|nr:enoyl-CoA hydratase isomerase family [Rhizoctonia solani]
MGISCRGFASARPLSREYQNILVSRPKPNVTLLTLNRPKALNALSTPLFEEINEVLDQVEKDEEVGALVVTGSEKAFAAGADIKEMKDKQFTDVYKTNFLGDWTRITSFPKPVIAAVSGFALGGGCELAMMCDIILASPTARFGQPEIKLGVIPGAGGTQRLTHAIGKSRAMELVLTGRMITAQEAEKWGLVSRIIEGDLVEEAVSMASTIAGFGRVAVQAGKESVNAAYELSLKDGLHFERRLFQSLFATRDQKEGMWKDSITTARKEALGLREAFSGGTFQLLNPFSWGARNVVSGAVLINFTSVFAVLADERLATHILIQHYFAQINMSSNLGKRARPPRTPRASSPTPQSKTSARKPDPVMASPAHKRTRIASSPVVAGKENQPPSTSKLSESRARARARARKEVDIAEDPEDDEASDQGSAVTSQKSAKRSVRLPSPVKTPPKETKTPNKSPVKQLPDPTSAPRLPSLVSRLQLTPPATPPVTVLSLHARARALLRPGVGEVIGRDKERAILTNFLTPFLTGKPQEPTDKLAAYISGAPGTGKTALVSEVLRTVAKDQVKGIYVNCTGLKEENSVWARVLEEGGFPLPKGKGSAGSEKKKFESELLSQSIKCVVVLDELDFVLRTPSALSSIFDLAQIIPTCLRIIGISNTLTLGATDSQTTTTAANDFLTLDVSPYVAEDIVKIVQGRLSTLEPASSGDASATARVTGASLVIAPTALTFLSKKLSTQTGDLRAALDAVRRTIELAEREVNPFAPSTPSKVPTTTAIPNPAGNPGVATMKHALDALRGRDGLAGGQAVGTARGLGMQARLVMISILVARRRAAAGLVILPVKSVNNLTRTPSKAPPRTPSRTSRGSQQTSPSKRSRAGESELYEASALHAAYTAILTSDGAFAPVSRSEFQDLLGVLETGGLVKIVGNVGQATPSRRKATAISNEPLVGLAEGIREEDILRGLGNAGAGGTAGVKEEEAMSLWDRELKRSMRDVERVKRAAEREKEAAAVDGFADACAND